MVSEFPPECLNECLAHACLLVKSFKLISLLTGAISSNRANVNHAGAVLDKCASLDRDVEVCDVMQAEVDKFLQ